MKGYFQSQEMGDTGYLLWNLEGFTTYIVPERNYIAQLQGALLTLYFTQTVISAGKL